MSQQFLYGFTNDHTVMHQEVFTLLLTRAVTVCSRDKGHRGEGCVKWSLENQNSYTLFPEASFYGTTLGDTHTHAQ